MLPSPGRSIEERYRDVDDYLGQVRTPAHALVHDHLMVEEDVTWV